MGKKLNLEGYYKKIAEGLKQEENKDAVLSNLKISIDDFLIDNPNANMTQIYSNFGRPEQIIADNSSSVSLKIYVHDVRSPRQIIYIVLAFITAVILLLCVFYVLIYIDANSRPTVVYKDLSEYTTRACINIIAGGL